MTQKTPYNPAYRRHKRDQTQGREPRQSRSAPSRRPAPSTPEAFFPHLNIMIYPRQSDLMGEGALSDRQGSRNENRPKIGAAAAKLYVEKRGRYLSEIMKSQTAGLSEIMKSLSEIMKRQTTGMQTLMASLEGYRALMSTVKKSTTLQARKIFDEIAENYEPLKNLIIEIDDLQPDIGAELEKAGISTDELDRMNVSELLTRRDDPNDDIYRAFEAAKAARAAALPVISNTRAKALENPLDKINFKIWEREAGAVKFDMTARNDKNPEKVYIPVTLTFEGKEGTEISTTSKLTHFDKRVQLAVYALFEECTAQERPAIFTIGDIWRAMGNTRRPNENQVKKINESLTKQGATRVFFDTKNEAARYKYERAIVDSNILKFTRIQALYKGRIVTAVHPDEAPILIQFAATRGQITAVPLKVLQSGIPMTDSSLRIEDYLLRRIAMAKNSLKKLETGQGKKYSPDRQKKIKARRKEKILFSTFHKNIGTDGKDKRKRDRDRAIETAEKYLQHYKECSYISGYTLLKDGFSISL